MSTSAKRLFSLTSAGGLALSAIISMSTLSGCGNTQKENVSTTEQTPAGTVTTTTSVTTDVSPNGGGALNPNGNTTVITGTSGNTGGGDTITVQTPSGDGPDDVHVNMPGVHVNGDDEKVNIDVPFVHIHKDGAGNTRIKAPFVRINTHDDDN